jgi:quinoprotein glucose dehydrogenase
MPRVAIHLPHRAIVDARRWCLTLLLIAVGVTVGARSAGQNGAGSRSVRDGVYTGEQAKKGDAAYQDKCAACHEGNLAGSVMGPSLVGSSFIDSWTGKDLYGLFNRARTTMPADNPSSLGDATYLEIIALVLKTNGFTAGTTELTPDADALKNIRIEPNK